MPTAKEMSILSSHAEALHGLLGMLRDDTFVWDSEGVLREMGRRFSEESAGAQAFCWMHEIYPTAAAMVKAAEAVAHHINETIYSYAEAMTQDEFKKERQTA